MAFQQPKLDVLESKLKIYEELSREMLNKLESAVEKISESNSRIATILTKHDEKIMQNSKTDELILNIIDELKVNNKEEHAKVINKVDNLEKKIEDFSKFRWITAGAIIILSFMLTQSNVVVDILTPNSNSDSIERVK